MPAAGRTLHLAARRARCAAAASRGAVARARPPWRAGCGGALGCCARLRPRLVVGVGGYASVAGVLAARAAARAGRAARAERDPRARRTGASGASRSRVCLGFAEAAPLLSPGARGPHRQPGAPRGAGGARRCAAATGRGLLVFGGSQGAHRLNEAGVAALEALGPIAPGAPRPAPDRGRRSAATSPPAYQRLGVDARVEAFVDDMGAAYREADVVVVAGRAP